MSSKQSSDVVVVGGGVMGLFTALNLAEQGRNVTVVERGRIWSEASAVNAGSLAAQNKLPPLVPYTLAAFDVWKSLPERIGCDVDYHQTGGYKIATTPEEVARLRAGLDAQRAAGLPVRFMEPEEIRSETPWLSDKVLAATYCELDSFASPIRTGPGLHKALSRLGVTILEDTHIRSIKASSGTVHLDTNAGAIDARQLAITAGAWSGKVAAMLGSRVDMSLDVNMVSVTEPAPFTIGKIVTHARGILTLKQVSNGSCLIGGGWQGNGSIDDQCKDVDPDQLTHNFILANEIIPGLGPLHILRSWAGYEGVSPDSLPYLGQLPGFDNIFMAACARGGFTLGPLFGQLLCELMTTGKPSMPLEAFHLARFDNA
ncbi:MAG TPA: FAD-dependent oxidoreductase [Rhizobiaceae bacterium]